MKIALLTVIVIAAGCTRTGYVDPQRAVKQTDEWRSAEREAKAYADSHQPDLDKAQDAIKKAREAKASAEVILSDETKASQLENEINGEVSKRLNAVAGKIWDRMGSSLGKVAADHHVSGVIPLRDALWIDHDSDLTDYLAKAYDRDQAGAELQALREQVAQQAKQGSAPIAKK
jgi:Skp family chaperone for outer membrane proteins